MAAAVAIFSVAFLLLFPLVAQSQQVEFIYTGFNESEGNITTEGAIIIKPSAAYYLNGSEEHQDEIILESGNQIHAWIEYDGLEKAVNVTIAPASQAKPTEPLIFFRDVDLTRFLKERMYVGFSAATGEKSSSHYILGWSFSQKGEAPDLNIYLLPLPPPREKSPSSFKPLITAVIASLSVFTFILLGLLFSLTLYRKLAHHESLEEWELDCPHRFRYRDLYAATKGFKESKVIGVEALV
ncbi:hypothetical protein FH972_017144 [Carpinus fangiana]|uniref:Legume lectin domain-containing protein n=1 Tax=Carpinus fangiana TaxID=176857 RepID=A0A5N6RLW4_9ROSI|nr:hypothetical protein FH972_017144 [Carpinus fangiana]